MLVLLQRPGLKYRLASGVRIVRLDDEAVVFNPFSWETHIFNASAALMLEALLREPCGHDDLARVVEDAVAEDERPLAMAHVQRVMAELESLRLVCAVPDAAG